MRGRCPLTPDGLCRNLPQVGRPNFTPCGKVQIAPFCNGCLYLCTGSPPAGEVWLEAPFRVEMRRFHPKKAKKRGILQFFAGLAIKFCVVPSKNRPFVANDRFLHDQLHPLLLIIGSYAPFLVVRAFETAFRAAVRKVGIVSLYKSNNPDSMKQNSPRRCAFVCWLAAA